MTAASPCGGWRPASPAPGPADHLNHHRQNPGRSHKRRVSHVSYKIITDFTDSPTRCEGFHGPGCRGRMMSRYHDLVEIAETSADHISQIRVLGTVGNKTDTFLFWRRTRLPRERERAAA